MLPLHDLSITIERTVREEWGRILAALTKSLGDLQLAEDCLQEAVVVAMERWQADGLPASPAAWLIVTARRKAIDRLRRAENFASKQAELSYLADLAAASESDLDGDMAVPDERLRLMFTCCHPALEEKTQVALTLRTLGGLATEEIARAFLDRPDAMAQRLVRAKRKIKAAGIPYQVPETEDLPVRLASVLRVIYLIFNEGYAASAGIRLIKDDLSDEAIRLARIVRQLMPQETEVAGLLALMLLHDSRRHARLGKDGAMIALEQQNRARWDKAKIAEGCAILRETLPKQRIGPYQLQAAISAVHAESASWQDTDWAQIAALYGLLYQMQPTPVVRLNQAVAVSYAASPQAGLDMLDEVALGGALETYQPYYAARADLLIRLGYTAEAKTCLEQAIGLTDNEPEKAFLKSRKKRIEN